MSPPASSGDGGGQGTRDATARGIDPFAIFDLPRRFALDAVDLRRRFVRLLAEAHPDRAGTDPARQAEAARRSAEITAAYRILESPVSRAEALLERAGAKPLGANALPPAFLVAMMETREALDEAIAGGDVRAVEAARTLALSKRDDLLASLGRALDGPAAQGDPAALDGARLDVAALRYVERLLERASLDPA